MTGWPVCPILFPSTSSTSSVIYAEIQNTGSYLQLFADYFPGRWFLPKQLGSGFITLTHIFHRPFSLADGSCRSRWGWIHNTDPHFSPTIFVSRWLLLMPLVSGPIRLAHYIASSVGDTVSNNAVHTISIDYTCHVTFH